MPPKLSWTQLARFNEERDLTKFRWEEFCCSAVYWVRTRWCIICPGDHEMVERRLRCRSPNCNEPPRKCPVVWKIYECSTSSCWVVLSNDKVHLRGRVECSQPPRPKVTPEMREYIQRMDDNSVPPRLIWSNLLRAPEIPPPALGFPSCAQVLRNVKYNRWLQGTKNSITKVRELVQSKAFVAGIDAETAFIFGNREDDKGLPFVGNGQDEEPLILGITSLKLMQNIVALQARESFLIFHLDATFKLSDLGYPVVTCGFTDRTRSYQLAGLFIVSQRTQREYREAIGAFARIFRRHTNFSLRLDAVMDDAEDAQLNGLRDLEEFTVCPYLMCFFHVLHVYNVRKRVRHLPDSVRTVVYRGILDMHYTLNHGHFLSEWSRVCHEWQCDRRLHGFTMYFYTQWLQSRFWRWQIYHSPGGYATTNNPCEVFNASIKRYTLRKASDTYRLIQKMLTIAEDYSVCVPPARTSTTVPAPDAAKKLARTLVTTNRVAVYATGEQSVVRVLYLGDEAIEALDAQHITGLLEVKIPNSTGTFVMSSAGCLTDTEKTSAAKFYRSAVKWTVRRAHHVGMPRGGWVVHLNAFTCSCFYFKKFLSCAHVICGRAAYGLSVPGVNGYHLKFKDRRVRRNQSTRANTGLGALPPIRIGTATDMAIRPVSSPFGLARFQTSQNRTLSPPASNLGPPHHVSPNYDITGVSSYNPIVNNLVACSANQNQLVTAPTLGHGTASERYDVPASYGTMEIPHVNQGEGQLEIRSDDYIDDCMEIFRDQDIQSTTRVTSAPPGGYDQLTSDQLESENQHSTACITHDGDYYPLTQPDYLPTPTERVPIQRRVGRPPLASHALDIPFLLR